MNRRLLAILATCILTAGALVAAHSALPTTRTAMKPSTPATRPTTAPAGNAEACSINQPGNCGEVHWQERTEAEWKKLLTPEQYQIAREAGTERAFTGKYWNTHTKGVYHCAVCDQPLFSSDTKFDSGTGWPSYYQPVTPNAVVSKSDSSLGMERTEVLCSRCGSHLGHVFNDGPKPTGLRYCMNSAVLNLVEEKK